jgi:hypothetical protein
MRMQYKMPNTWELLIIAVANNAGLNKYADACALRAALSAAAAPDRYGWPADTMQGLKLDPAPGPPMPIAKAFQTALHPPKPAAQTGMNNNFEVPDQVVAHAPKRRFDDRIINGTLMAASHGTRNSLLRW